MTQTSLGHAADRSGLFVGAPRGLDAVRGGRSFACRYLSHDQTGKNLTLDEAAALCAAGQRDRVELGVRHPGRATGPAQGAGCHRGRPAAPGGRRPHRPADLLQCRLQPSRRSIPDGTVLAERGAVGRGEVVRATAASSDRLPRPDDDHVPEGVYGSLEAARTLRRRERAHPPGEECASIALFA